MLSQLIVIAALLLVCVGASPISSVHVPVPLSLSDSMTALSSTAALTSALQRSANVSDSGVCAVCVNFVTQYIVGAYIDAVKAECAHPRSAKEIADCQWIAAHPQVFLGALVETIKPVRSAVFYCAGAKYCGSADEARAAITPPATTASDNAAIAIQLEESVTALLNDDVLSTTPAAAGDVTPTKYTDGFIISVGQDLNVTCAQCLAYWVDVQIAVALRDIAAFCQAHSGIPKIAALCQFIANHVPFVIGALLVRIQPIKFAAGICLGAQYCPGNQQNK